MTNRMFYLAASAVLTLFNLHAFAAPVYRVVELPVRHGGGIGVAINEEGTVGVDQHLPQLCVKGKPRCKKLQKLDGDLTFVISDLNDRGITVGAAAWTLGRDLLWRPVLWFHGEVRDLATYNNDPELTAFARGVNRAGTVVGGGAIDHDYPFPGRRAFVWKDGAIFALPTLGGNYGYARGINSSSVIVGGSTSVDGAEHAFTYDLRTGVITDMGCGTGYRCTGVAINEAGDIAAYGQPSEVDSTTVAMRSVDGIMQILPRLPGDDYAIPYAINGAGDVVGYSRSSLPGRGFLYTTADGVMELTTTLRARDRATYVIQDAMGINNAGEIAALAVRVSDGKRFAVRLQPIR